MNTIADKDNFLQLIQENKGIIFKICNSYCKNKDEREDLVQEIIYNLWKSGNQFNADYKFSTWMYRVALNVAISFYRQEKKATIIIPMDDAHINIEDGSTSEENTEKKIILLQQFIAEMKALDRALILLWFESKSYKEIAEIVGISETNVATKISRIKEKLKQQFATSQQ